MLIKSIIGISVVTSVIGGAARAETVEEYLRAFHANPVKMMQRLPSEVVNGVARPRGYINEKRVADSLKERVEVRDSIMSNRVQALRMEEPEGKDRAERLLEPGNPVINNVREMEARALTRASLDPLPWTDSYWPMYKGLLGTRYSDRSFPNSKNWGTNYSYISANPASAIVAYGDSAAINRLSPSEKYDFAVGDTSFTLTNFSWNQGRKYFEKSGRVAGWMGICHGWAAAASMLAPVPDEPITVVAANGTPITFYPQDVKALQSMLWANASPATRFVGNRCNVSRPSRDAYGRIVDPVCWDSNPGTWHTAVVNQMGQNRRSFVMDATYDAEVWNFPLANYQYRYFNAQTWQETTNLAAAAIPIEKFKLDKFRQYRSPNARYIVGVYMDVSHVNAINPTRGTVTTPPLKTLRFIYDLELDEAYNIIGGEWYSNVHPDFMWTFAKDSKAMSIGDTSILNEAWMTSSPVPSHWAEHARRASGRGEPLYSFVRRLAEGNAGPIEEEDGNTNPEEVNPGHEDTPAVPAL